VRFFSCLSACIKQQAKEGQQILRAI